MLLLSSSIQQQQWKSKYDFAKAQAAVAVVLSVAYIGDRWPQSYPRNDNHKPYMFWLLNAIMAVGVLATLKHDPSASSRGVQLLSRPQTEEWKGWMQWAFILVRMMYCMAIVVLALYDLCIAHSLNLYVLSHTHTNITL